MAQILHATLNQHRPDSEIPHESASSALGTNSFFERPRQGGCPFLGDPAND
jgi:hypothetical protein